LSFLVGISAIWQHCQLDVCTARARSFSHKRGWEPWFNKKSGTLAGVASLHPFLVAIRRYPPVVHANNRFAGGGGVQPEVTSVIYDGPATKSRIRLWPTELEGLGRCRCPHLYFTVEKLSGVLYTYLEDFPSYYHWIATCC
jgi:hypothetical protein